jgi:hypothetical protein
MGNQRAKGGFTLHFGGATLQTKERRAMPMITYQDLFLFCTFIVALISLLYQILKDRKK